MTFEVAKAVSLVLHYCIVIGLAGLFVFRRPTLLRIFFRIYGVLFVWVGLTFLSGGCPITFFENWISTKLYGQPFYPHYGFTDTDAYKLLQHWDLLLPLPLMLLLCLFLRRRYPLL